MNRGPKRQAVSSPSPPPALVSDKDELRCIIKEIIKEEFSEMLTHLNKTVISTINQELLPIKEEIEGIRESMFFMNAKFEDLKKGHESSKETVKKLEQENQELKTTVVELNERLNNLEQQSRSNNLEVQCVPENKNENVYSIIAQLARVVNCDISEKDVVHCTRIAKTNSSSTRPRSIIVQLSTIRKRDELLAATIKYNKTNPQDKLNCSHLGYAGPITPVYVAEHLSPTNRALHAATRIKAKEKNYKYIWVRNGRIFVRKTDGEEVLQIKTKNGLSKII
ncbi:putative leucine-rich repeat-containing protein DDB_G0290503 [Trichoplusia ni]|uniref:Leucine-rich repeat-containing protein DDB_G0290503 n=1 Tax=Trichoplusia ni TaxID=7111 RepID=A0A7E5WWJ4_TRINI|nr:putative leucine-rich repeat-containing protein DDB_G0290503 [Trichoplusia ni]